MSATSLSSIEDVPSYTSKSAGRRDNRYITHNQNMELPPPCSPLQQYDNHMQPPSCNTSFRGIERGIVSSSFESSYHVDHQSPNNGEPPFDGSYHYYHWQMPHVEYITNVKTNDVLSGRGGATNSHSGNRLFRSLVQQYKSDYLKAKKRDKPQVAAIVVDKIRERGGRFLRRYKTDEGMVWIEIGDARAKEKTCQALREGAPAIRRRKAASDSDGTLSATSTFDRTVPEGEEENKLNYGGRTQIVRTSYETEKEEADATAGVPIVIRPSMTLICRSLDQALAIPVDDLDESEREIYLRDFLPPNPAVQKKKTPYQSVISSVDGIVHYDTSRVFEGRKRDLWV